MEKERDVLKRIFAETYPDAVTKALVPFIQQTLAFRKVDADDTPLGATRMGGQPDAGPYFVWPTRKPPADLEAQMEAWSMIEEVTRNIGRERPMSFVMQIDLEEARKTGDLASALPENGRLLFFLDQQVTAWVGGVEACHVIWDETPKDALKRHGYPAALLALEEEERQANNLVFKTVQLLGKLMGSSDLQDYDPKLRITAQSCLIEQVFTLPGVNSFDFAAMKEVLEDTVFKTMSEEEKWDVEENLMSDDNYNFPLPTLAVALGPTWPDQSDPRGEDVVLLLQTPVAHMLDDAMNEGNYYFLIHKDDLAKRDFSRVLVEYQQT